MGIVEGVVIASPPASHEPLALACLAAGKRVLCEKPLAGSAAACRRLVEADAGGRLTTAFMRRYDPAYAELRRAGTIISQQMGAKALDEQRTDLQRGDIVAAPVNNVNYSPFRPELVLLREMLGAPMPFPRFVATMKGELVVLAASPKGYEELGRATILGTTRQAPALSGGLLYLRDDKEIVCLDVR